MSSTVMKTRRCNVVALKIFRKREAILLILGYRVSSSVANQTQTSMTGELLVIRLDVNAYTVLVEHTC